MLENIWYAVHPEEKHVTSSGCSFFSDECESAPKTAGDVFISNKLSRTQYLWISK